MPAIIESAHQFHSSTQNIKVLVCQQNFWVWHWGHWNYPLVGSSWVNHKKILIFHILFSLFYLFFIWGGWHSGIAHSMHNWKVLRSNPTDGTEFGTQPHYEVPGNLQVEHIECVSLTISYHLYFLCISKILSSYITGQWGKFTVKNATLCFYIYFLDIFCYFSSKKKCVFIIFISFFDEVSNCRNSLLTNQKPE